MISSSIKAIIFDLGGVILNIDYNKSIEAFESLGMENFHNVFSQASQTGLFDDLETGQISAQRFINCLLPHLKKGTSPNQVVHAWEKMVLNVPKENLDLLLKLREKYKIFLLSNTNEIHIPHVRRKWAVASELPMEDFFDKIYFSHEIKMRKPHPEIFQYVCEDQSLKPETTLFIDDSIQHIEGAKKIGLHTKHLKAPETIIQFFS